MEQPHLQTSRLIIREILPSDLEGMYELDSNPNVHKYLGNKPVTSKQQCAEAITNIRQQYLDLGIGRWAMIEKNTGNFIGWTGFKFNTEEECGRVNFLDLGYRLKEEFWGNGFASEGAIASMDWIFENWDHDTIIGMAMVANKASNHILNNTIGMRLTDHFEWENEPCLFYEITKEEWLNRK